VASIECISSCLEQVSAAYNRPGSWMAKCTSLWEREFATRTDGQLDRALRMWVRAEPKAPTIAELHALMDGEGRNGTLGQVNQSQDLVCYGNLSLQVVAYLVALLWVREGLIVAYVVQLLLL